MNPIVSTVLGWVLPIALAPIVYFVARELLNVSRKIDDLPVFAKRIAVGAIGVLTTAAFSALGFIAPPECAGLPTEFTAECVNALNAPVVVKGLTAALVAFAIHALKKSKPTT